MVDNVSSNLIAESTKLTKNCDACKKHKMNHQFYNWYSLLTDKYLGSICSPCSYNEGFGNKYKQNKKYKTWKEKSNG